MLFPPYYRAIQALHELKDSKLWQQGQEKAYYTTLTEILREYIDERFHINAMEMTSSQIIETLHRYEETKAVYRQLRDILEMADFGKFVMPRLLLKRLNRKKRLLNPRIRLPKKRNEKRC